VTAVLAGIGVSNGIAWSLDGRTVYYIDSAAGGVDAFPFDATTGTWANG
jgi:sugar lactone lactonase YvrE